MGKFLADLAVVICALIASMWMGGCYQQKHVEFIDDSGAVHATPVSITKETRFMYLDPYGTNLVAKDVSGFNMSVVTPVGLGINFAGGGATEMSVPPDGDMVVENGAALDAEGNPAGFNRRVSTGQLTSEPEENALQSILNAVRGE